MVNKLLKTALGRLRIIAFIEGCSFLLLGFTMILKYKFSIPQPNYIVGLAHGILFVLYIVLLLQVSFLHRRPNIGFFRLDSVNVWVRRPLFQLQQLRQLRKVYFHPHLRWLGALEQGTSSSNQKIFLCVLISGLLVRVTGIIFI